MTKNIKSLDFKNKNYFNYLYLTNDSFIGYMKKLTKEEKELLNAKLIWKRKNKI